MSLQDLAAAGRGPPETGAVIRRGMRMALVGLGLLLMLVGIPVTLLLHTPGLLIEAAGLIVVLRNSFTARRHFVRAQRRHPKILFPVRRIIRRDTEVVAVIWQMTLRTERLILPSRARFCVRTRRRIIRRRRA